jgi:hypothetical protein
MFIVLIKNLNLILQTKKIFMKPSAPKKNLWLISVIIGILGIVGHFVHIEFISQYSLWFLIVGFGLLAIGTTFKGF